MYIERFINSTADILQSCYLQIRIILFTKAAVIDYTKLDSRMNRRIGYYVSHVIFLIVNACFVNTSLMYETTAQNSTTQLFNTSIFLYIRSVTWQSPISLFPRIINNNITIETYRNMKLKPRRGRLRSLRGPKTTMKGARWISHQDHLLKGGT